MTISSGLEAKILRYYHVEKWRVGTIARCLGVHHGTIKRVLAQTGVPKAAILPQPSMIDPYRCFIMDTLTQYPSLTASRLYEMVRTRGYPGGLNHFRHMISIYRPKPIPEAYLRLRTLPGEQAQVDWGHFGHIMIGKAKRPVMAFVMVLSYSRKIFLQFYLNQRMSNFLRGHEGAFNAFGGVPKVLLYDNLKSAVLERRDDAIRFHPTLLEFSAHYHFEPRPVAVARGNEKGRVERAIRYVRDNFFPAREWHDIDDLNRQATLWCEGTASNRPCPEDRSRCVKNVFEEEQSTLLSLPDNPYQVDDQEEVTVAKTPYVRFDLNDYSVPHTYVRRILSLRATQDVVKIFDGTELIATHQRSYDKGAQVENELHIENLIAQKKQAKQHRGQDRLTQAIPSASLLLKQAAERGYSLRTTTNSLLLLLDDYGAVELEIGIKAALEKSVPHANTVRIYLECRREEQNKLPPVRLDLPDDQRVREQIVRPHKLEHYDDLQTQPSRQEEKEHDNQ